MHWVLLLCLFFLVVFMVIGANGRFVYGRLVEHHKEEIHEKGSCLFKFSFMNVFLFVGLELLVVYTSMLV